MELVIKEATDEEKDWTARLIAGSEPWLTLGTSLETCLRFCHDNEYLVFTAHLGSLPCGSMVIHPRGLASSPYLKSIVVASEFRGKKVGSALLDFAENYFRERSKHFFMCVSSFNPRARKLYESLGYKQVGEFPDYIVPGESEILLHKRIR
ncbi:MAG: GNAT family N-acetyltransferase [Bacteroidales bacterium]